MNIRDLIVGEWTITPVPEGGRACMIDGDGGRKISVIASLDPLIGFMVTARVMEKISPSYWAPVQHLSSLSTVEETKVLARVRYPERLQAFPGARWIDTSVSQVVRNLKD